VAQRQQRPSNRSTSNLPVGSSIPVFLATGIVNVEIMLKSQFAKAPPPGFWRAGC
jgi:hypothetical protein